MVFARSLSDLIQVVSGSVEPQELIGTDILSVQDVFFGNFAMGGGDGDGDSMAKVRFSISIEWITESVRGGYTNHRRGFPLAAIFWSLLSLSLFLSFSLSFSYAAFQFLSTEDTVKKRAQKKKPHTRSLSLSHL